MPHAIALARIARFAQHSIDACCVLFTHNVAQPFQFRMAGGKLLAQFLVFLSQALKLLKLKLQ